MFVLGFHACRALITLYLPRADTCLCLCGLLAGLDHLFTRAASLPVTLHANAQPRAPSTRLRTGCGVTSPDGAAGEDKSQGTCFLSAAPEAQIAASQVDNAE